MTPTEVLAARIADLEAQLQLRDERLFYVVAALAAANAQLGITDFSTTPTNVGGIGFANDFS